VYVIHFECPPFDFVLQLVAAFQLYQKEFLFSRLIAFTEPAV